MPLPLETERLVLRAPERPDFEAFYDGIWSDPVAMRRWRVDNVTASEEEADEFLRKERNQNE